MCVRVCVCACTRMTCVFVSPKWWLAGYEVPREGIKLGLFALRWHISFNGWNCQHTRHLDCQCLLFSCQWQVPFPVYFNSAPSKLNDLCNVAFHHQDQPNTTPTGTSFGSEVEQVPSDGTRQPPSPAMAMAPTQQPPSPVMAMAPTQQPPSPAMAMSPSSHSAQCCPAWV